MRRLLPPTTLLALLACAASCTDDGTGSEAAELGTETAGDPTTTGDGDGDPATGDGDGDPASGDGDGDPSGDGDGDAGCVYPDAAEPMALDEPIAAYAWPTAIHADGTDTPLDLEDAYCDTDAVIDWSPHDLLVFISIPAW